MSDNNGGKNIGELNDIPQFDSGALFPVFYSGVTYKYTLGQLLSQANRNTVGLGSVDNTADLDKPISTATQTALNAKANVSHGHDINDVANLGLILTNKSDIGHAHSVEEISGLSQTLQAKANSSHTHVVSSVDGLQTALDEKAASIHGHDINSVSGLVTVLATKADAAAVSQALLGKSDLNHFHDASEITNLPELPEGLATETFVMQAIANEPVHSHVHSISSVTGLQTELDSKAQSVHQHAISDVSGLSANLASKAEQIHQHGIGDVTGLNQALALKADTTFVTQQIDTKANVVHTHTTAQITDLAATLNPYALQSEVTTLLDATVAGIDQTIETVASSLQTSLDSLTLVVDNKSDTGHTHSVSDIDSFGASVKNVVAGYLLPGSNIELVDGPSGLTINSTGGGSTPVVSNSLKIFRLTSQSQYYEFSESQTAILDNQYVIGEDLVTFSSYGSLYQFDKDGIYRIRVTVTAYRTNQGTPPTVVPPASNQISYGSKVSNYNNVQVFSFDTQISKTAVDLMNSDSEIHSWSNEYIINSMVAGSQLMINTFLYGKSGEPLDPADWEMTHDTTIVVERMSGITDNFVRAPGNLNILKVFSDAQSIEQGQHTVGWEIDTTHANTSPFVTYDGGLDEFVINETGYYRVTVQSMVGRSGNFSDSITVTPDAFLDCSYGTLTNTSYGLEILSDNRFPNKGRITLTEDSEFAAWLHEFYIDVTSVEARLTIKDWFNANVPMPIEWLLLFSATITFERIGDSLAAPA